MSLDVLSISFFFNDTATTEIYTLSLHDALPISIRYTRAPVSCSRMCLSILHPDRSEEHTSELQSRVDISYAVFCLKKYKDNDPRFDTLRDRHVYRSPPGSGST